MLFVRLDAPDQAPFASDLSAGTQHPGKQLAILERGSHTPISTGHLIGWADAFNRFRHARPG